MPDIKGRLVQAKSKAENTVGMTASLAESRKREAALREVLQVISRSREDEAPVFDIILKRAANLCGAPHVGLHLIDEESGNFVIRSIWGGQLMAFDEGYTYEPDTSPIVVHAINRKQSVQIEDAKADAVYQSGNELRKGLIEEEGIRTFLAVPLLSGDTAIGYLALFRKEVRPFTDDEILLVETFASQAVIAIENTRQFHAIQTRLEREAATADILEVISRSQDDETPVYNTILKHASKLCHAPVAMFGLITENRKHFVVPAHIGARTEYIDTVNANPPELDPDKYAAARAMVEMRTIAIEDLADPKLYGASDTIRKQSVALEGIRSAFCVPLILNSQAVGGLFLYRREVSAFTQDEISLVETFASQAVIAIKNVRQFRALESLNAELGDRVENQVAEIERMGKLKRFLPAAVADTVISQGSEHLLSSHRALLGVLFCDIRGFTAFCETAEPEETIEVLQTYHEEMGKLINAHGAGVDHRMGDGIMVLFNDPVPCKDPAGDAVRLAIAMRSHMNELAKKWKRLGHRLGFGVGISLGYATVGMEGYEGRYDYTASGTAVNLAARLCDQAEDGEILLSTRASIAVEDDFECESAGEFELKGMREPVEVFRLSTTDRS